MLLCPQDNLQITAVGASLMDLQSSAYWCKDGPCAAATTWWIIFYFVF